MENQNYMREGLDIKRVALLMRKKLWMPVAAAVAGAIFCAGIYLLAHVVFAPAREFQSVSKLYLNFNCEPEDFNELSYNGYTWNDLMATDPILDYTMKGLPDGTERAVVAAATKAEILSDIRLLTITVTTGKPEMAAQIMEATQESLVHLGETDSLFESIEVYSTVGPQQIVWDNRTGRAAVAGAALGLCLALMVMAFYYVLDDSVYVAEDVEKRYGIPAFGVLVAGNGGKGQPFGREFAINYAYLCRGVQTVVLVGLEDREEVKEAGRILTQTLDAEASNVRQALGKGHAPSADEAGRAGAALSAKRGSYGGLGIGEGGETQGRELAPKDRAVEGIRGNGEGEAFPRLVAMGSLEEDADLFCRIREADGVVLAVRYGGRNGKRLERALGNLKKQDGKVLGAVVVHADETFLKWYYMGAKRKGGNEVGEGKTENA